MVRTAEVLDQIRRIRRLADSCEALAERIQPDPDCADLTHLTIRLRNMANLALDDLEQDVPRGEVYGNLLGGSTAALQEIERHPRLRLRFHASDSGGGVARAARRRRRRAD